MAAEDLAQEILTLRGGLFALLRVDAAHLTAPCLRAELRGIIERSLEAAPHDALGRAYAREFYAADERPAKPAKAEPPKRREFRGGGAHAGSAKAIRARWEAQPALFPEAGA